MNEFLLNCLKEIANGAQAIQLAIIAYVAYVEGSNDANAEPPTQEIKDFAQLTKLLPTPETNEIQGCDEQVEQEEIISVSFTEKELFYMPLQFRKEYRMDGTVVRCRKRPTGYNKFTYEMRYRRDGYNVTATAKSLEECKSKFLAKLKEADKQVKEKTNTTTKLKTFAIYYFENFKKRKVAESTYTADLSRLNNCILPALGNKDLKEITPSECQTLIDNLVAQGKGKSAEETFCLLNQIFKGAIKHSYITQNPMDLVIKTKHEREHGKALTLQEEAEFVQACKNDKYATVFITALYTGMRPNEYAHAEFKDGFIITINSKRKGGKLEYKKIPVHPMFAPYVDDRYITEFNTLKKTELNTLRSYFYRNYSKWADKLYDLRTTFYTRCEMVGIAEPARNEFIGHSGGTLKDTYTDLPDSYLIQEAQKLRYNLDF